MSTRRAVHRSPFTGLFIALSLSLAVVGCSSDDSESASMPTSAASGGSSGGGVEAPVENEGGDRWWETIPTGALTTRWQQATSDGGALFRLRNSLWIKRRHLREDRDMVLRLTLPGALPADPLPMLNDA